MTKRSSRMYAGLSKVKPLPRSDCICSLRDSECGDFVVCPTCYRMIHEPKHDSSLHAATQRHNSLLPQLFHFSKLNGSASRSLSQHLSLAYIASLTSNSWDHYDEFLEDIKSNHSKGDIVGVIGPS
jgi:hypothetical protein